MRVVVTFAVDNSVKYWRMLLGVITSLRQCNTPDYVIRVYGVGIGNDFTSRLTAMGCEVYSAPSTPTLFPQSYFPCSAAKCLALAEAASDEIVLTLDVDGLVLSPITLLVDEFMASGMDVAILPETDKRGNASAVKECWFGCPLQEFKDANSWLDNPILNCGMVLARGDPAKRIGTEALRLVSAYPQTLYLGEQGPINGVIYDRGYKVFPLAPYHHCIFVSEEHVSCRWVYRGNIPYLAEALVDGKPIVYRHFGNRYVENYQRALDGLLAPS